MDGNRFDSITRNLNAGPATRRGSLRLLAGVALGLLGGLSAAKTEAANGCRKEGKTCDRDKQCCSGLCKGTTCRRVPNQSVCTIRDDGCKSAPLKECGRNDGECGCFVTNNGRAICISPSLGGFGCESDAECEQQFGAGTICLGRRARCKGSFCTRVCPDPL